MAELADALDSDSNGRPCRFKSCYPHQKITVILIQSYSYFFIHYGVMVYHQKERENRSFLHIITLLVCIKTP